MNMLDNLLFNHFGKMILIPIVLIFGFMFYMSYVESQKSGFELKKDEWTCTLTSKHFNGKTYSIQCDQWSRK